MTYEQQVAYIAENYPLILPTWIEMFPRSLRPSRSSRKRIHAKYMPLFERAYQRAMLPRFRRAYEEDLELERILRAP